VAAIPLGLGLLGPGAHGTGWSLLVSAMMSVSLYWRRRAAFAVLAVCFALGLAQVTSWTDFTRILGPGEDTEVAVKARPGVPAAASASAVEAAVAAYPLIDITSEASLRAHLVSSIRKLAALLDGLLATSIVIALFGMTNTLSLSVLERTRESALLRALGLTRPGLRWMISLEAMLLGLMGGVAGVAFGIGFGWATSRTFLAADGGPVSYPVRQIVAYVALAAVAALLASVIPARRAARLSVIDGLAADLARTAANSSPSSRNTARGPGGMAGPGTNRSLFIEW